MQPAALRVVNNRRKHQTQQRRAQEYLRQGEPATVHRFDAQTEEALAEGRPRQPREQDHFRGENGQSGRRTLQASVGQLRERQASDEQARPPINEDRDEAATKACGRWGLHLCWHPGTLTHPG